MGRKILIRLKGKDKGCKVKVDSMTVKYNVEIFRTVKANVIIYQRKLAGYVPRIHKRVI